MRPVDGLPGAFDVHVEMRSKDWGAWDMFAADGNGERLRAVVDLPERPAAAYEVTAELWSPAGEPVVPGRVDAQVEAIDGGLRLHVQAAAPRGRGLGEAGSRAVFRARPVPATGR
jgi:hypothetical protein